jgi:PhzF family phenazine biosynthesis protein
MPAYAFRLVNVFAESSLAGNPLCVFEDATGMTDTTMQALARQFNLSETTFILSSSVADARVRIFSPAAEFPFAGHPTLGTAAVLCGLRGLPDRLTLEMLAGVIPVTRTDDRYTLQAGPATIAEPAVVSREALANMLGLEADAIYAQPLIVSTGNEQLLVPLRSVEDVMRCRPDARDAGRLANAHGLVKLFVWAPSRAGVVVGRFFFGEPGGALREDPGTGSACANLGAWLVRMGHPLPVRLIVEQGDALQRACRLHLTVDEQARIFVGGRVQEVGHGVITL